MLKVYGIPNCDTVKKTIAWLKDHNLEYQFHDFKKLGITEERLSVWAKDLGWEALLNKRGTTWKKLEPEVQQSVTSPAAAFKLMQEKTSVIKRPVVEGADIILSGFDPEAYKKLLK